MAAYYINEIIISNIFASLYNNLMIAQIATNAFFAVRR